MKISQKVLFIISLFVLGACSKKEDAPQPMVPHVAGTWSGSGTDDAVGYYNLAVDLTQSGNSASGTFTMASGVATIQGTISIMVGPQGGNNLQKLDLTRATWTVADPTQANRVCAGALTVKPSSTSMTGSAVSFSYEMTDCQGGLWFGGANMKKTVGTN